MKDCKFCDKKGLLILPLRYAAVVGERAAALLPPLPPSLGQGVSDIALSRAAYAPRLLREGFLYVLVQRMGIKSWQAYAVNEEGFLYTFPADRPPSVKPEFNCERHTCGIDASCVAIEHVDKVERAWLLFNPVALTPAKLREYKHNAAAYESQGRLQAFDPRAWARARAHAQPHTLRPDLLDTHVPEWLQVRGEHASGTELGRLMQGQLFPHPATPQARSDGAADGRLAKLADKLRKLEGAVFVVHDALGIVQELNNHRNAAIDPLRPWLQQTDPATGATNERKTHVLGAMDDVREAMIQGAIGRQQDFVAQHERSSEQFMERRLGTARQLRSMGRDGDARAIEEDVHRARQTRQANYERAMARVREQAPQAWQKYARRLPGMEPFRQAYERMAAAVHDQVIARVDDHLAWLQGRPLREALHAFDRTHPASGQAFADQIGAALHGMNYTEAGAALVMRWAADEGIDAGNLLMRAYCLNQEDIEAAVRASLASARQAATDATAQGRSGAWWRTLDLAQSGMQRAVDAFAKTQEALATQPSSPSYNGVFVSMGAAVYTAMGQALFKLGLNGQANAAMARYIALLSASLGRLNARVRLSELAHAATNLTPDAQRVQSQAVRRVREALQHEVAQGAAGDAYKLRAAGVIALIEAVGLLVRAREMGQDQAGSREVALVMGSALALVAAGFEGFAVGVEWVQKHYRSVTMSARGAAVSLGGLKLFAGSLAGFAGGIGAAYDFVDAKRAADREHRWLMAAYSLRGAAQMMSAFLGVAIGFSFCGPLFEFLAKRSSASTGQAGWSLMARSATWLARPAAGATVARVVILLRVVSCLTWVSLGLTVLMFVFMDDALEDWCECSVFRSNPQASDKSFTALEVELQELYVAFQEVS